MPATQRFDSIWLGADVATLRQGQYGMIKDGAVAVAKGRIAWVGPRADLPASPGAARHDFGGGVITPGFIDCHTHLVFGGNRSLEFEQRLQGVSYADIAAAGGGILSTVNATRGAGEEELLATAEARLSMLMAEGVTCIEIKSGYGLTLDDEIKMLRVARRIGQKYPIQVRTTFLAAHALPPEYRGRADEYIDVVCERWIPEVAALGLADAVDGFCEHLAFSPAQIARVFAAARRAGLPVKLHAEQLSSLGGSALAARWQALSADHLEYATEDDARAMASSGTVAVLLPGACYMLRETQLPPVALFRRHGVPMALASDINPGTSPACSLRLMINMGCTLFRLTPEEALAGVTLNAARALGLGDTLGSLETGKLADFVHWPVKHPAELAYWLGGQMPVTVVYRGERRR
ncbi:imidazolonepropionase [Sodalis ligni]|uniref:Imidazolonepropionase n=1 Tax=Sodalis ligni TaxID=2697027 RepID=A0A4R1N6B2_9GAMM|nr:imidazolonepropionase [Sodalis ligni]TCL02764.1 imidazolonepropionase [Sodalis ligni]